MAHFAGGLLVAAALAATAPAWSRADTPRGHSGTPAARGSYAPAAHHTHVAPPVYVASRPVVYPPVYASAAYPRVAYPPLRPPVVIRPAIAAYMPRPVYVAPRVVAVPGPYYVVVGAGYSGNNLAYPAETNWNWTPVDSVVSLAGRGQSDVRYYCPDSREYYPQAETCPSPWLKVVP